MIRPVVRYGCRSLNVFNFFFSSRRRHTSSFGDWSSDVCLFRSDTGNPMWVVEDPLLSLEVLAPYVVTTHMRDSAVCEHPRGASAQWVALGDGSIDFHKFVSRYRELCPGASMQLEIITGRPPRVLPYLEPD